MVVQEAVNFKVVGSSPTSAAIGDKNETIYTSKWR